jgi:signal transduction histidine kinase
VSRSRTWRAAILLASGLLGLIETYLLLHVLSARRLAQERVRDHARDVFMALRPELERALRPGDFEALQTTAREAFAASAAAEVEYFFPDGRPLLARPRVSPVGHWPGQALLETLKPGDTVLVFGPFLAPAPRVLSYAAMRWGDHVVLVRLSASAVDLATDIRAMGPTIVAHLASILLCAVLATLALLPERAAPESPGPALVAYEEAMERLRDQGQARDRAHAAELGRMEELLRDRQAMVRAGELTGGIVHEVRNGLGTITGYARLVEREGGAAAEAARAILEECGTLETVVRRFMDFIRDESLDLARFDLGRLLERVVARESRARPGIRVRLAPFPGPLEVTGDEALLERAFENLVRNALEAAAKEVSIRGVPSAGEVHISIADDGAGLPQGAGDEPKVFFTTKPGGLGLGLPTALKLVRLHGGRLSMTTGTSRGLEVEVALPVKGPPG